MLAASSTLSLPRPLRWDYNFATHCGRHRFGRKELLWSERGRGVWFELSAFRCNGRRRGSAELGISSISGSSLRAQGLLSSSRSFLVYVDANITQFGLYIASLRHHIMQQGRSDPY